MEIPTEIAEKLAFTLKELEMHREFDVEVNAHGCGFSSFEAIGGFLYLLDVLNIKLPKNTATDNEKRCFLESWDIDPAEYDL